MSIVAVHGPYTFGSKGISEVGPVVAVVNDADATKWTFKLDAVSSRSDQDFSWNMGATGTPSPQTVEAPTEVTFSSVAAPPTGTPKTVTLTVSNTAKATVNNKALTSNVATLSFSAAHGFAPGQWVVVTGVDTTFNGSYVLITAAGTTITYAKTAADVTSGAATGTVTSDPAQYPPAGAYPITITAYTGGAGTAGLRSIKPPDEEGPFDPGDHTIPEVEEYVTANPDQAQAVYDQEVDGKGRVTLITWLEEFEP